jgi:adenylate kinase
MKKLKVRDLDFEIYLEEKELNVCVVEMANKIHTEMKGKTPHFVAVLDGSFVFASDLLRAYPDDCKISFVKLSSYNGVVSSGEVQELIGLKEIASDETIVVIEDIVDTGTTLLKIDEIFRAKGREWQIASLFFKPKAYKGTRKIDFVGFEIPNDFIVGYGLDYDGYGRNLKNVYQLAKA